MNRLSSQLLFIIGLLALLVALVSQHVAMAQYSTGITTRVSVSSDNTEGNLDSFRPALSANGRYVTFYSGADNLVAGDTNGVWDIFMHDTQTGQTNLVSVSSNGEQGSYGSWDPAVSADGRYVVFTSSAYLITEDTNDSTDIFVHDRQTGQTSRVSVNSNGTQGNNNSSESTLSADGRYVAFQSNASNLVTGDTTDSTEISVHCRPT